MVFAYCAAPRIVAKVRAMMTHTELLDRIDRHLARTGESRAAFGKRVCNDPNLVSTLHAGRSPGLRLVQAICDATKRGAYRKGGK